MTEAEKILIDSGFRFHVIGIEGNVVREEDVIYLMEKYHEIKVNNSVLDAVKECLHPFNKVISGDEGDFCTECQKYLKTNRL